jgi:hypothetical protein
MQSFIASLILGFFQSTSGTKIDHVQGSIKLSRKGLLRRQSSVESQVKSAYQTEV